MTAWLARFVARVACPVTPKHRRFRRDVLIGVALVAATVVWNWV